MIRATISKADFNKMAKHLVKNIHWGTVVALTRTVGDARKDAVSEIRSVFQIRGGWVTGSFKKTEATKGNANATVGTIQRFLYEHEGGGQRHAADPNKTEGIPEYARRSKNMTTRPSKWPRALMGRNPSTLGARFRHFPPWAGRPAPKGPFYKQKKRGPNRGKIYGSKSRGGDRYFYLVVRGKKGPLKLLLQRQSKSGKRKKNRVWYAIPLHGDVEIKANAFWMNQIPGILKHLQRHMPIELKTALNHGRP